MILLQPFNLPAELHRERQQKHDKGARDLKESLQKFDYSLLKSLIAVVELPDEIPMASNPKWSDRQFGAVNTVQNSACVAFVSKIILDFFGIDVSMLDLLEEIEIKGYRMWKLANNKKTLNMPYPNADDLKKQFPVDDPIHQCHTLEDIYQLYGKPSGIGGSMFLIDSIIESIATKPIEVYHDTRIHSIDKLISNLSNGIIVPVRVENSIYHDDPSRKEGHYIVIYGIKNETAIVVDSSYDQNAGVNYVPIKRLFDAMGGNEKLIYAWDLSCV